jgi:hypothetical protein
MDISFWLHCKRRLGTAALEPTLRIMRGVLQATRLILWDSGPLCIGVHVRARECFCWTPTPMQAYSAPAGSFTLSVPLQLSLESGSCLVPDGVYTVGFFIQNTDSYIQEFDFDFTVKQATPRLYQVCLCALYHGSAPHCRNRTLCMAGK